MWAKMVCKLSDVTPGVNVKSKSGFGWDTVEIAEDPWATLCAMALLDL